MKKFPRYNQSVSTGDESGSLAGVLSLGLVLIVVLVVLVYGLFGKVVSPNEIGIRQNKFGILGVLKPGYENDGLEPGLHWRIPYVSDIILIPRGFQVVHLNSKEAKGGELSQKALQVQTTDGAKVLTDVSFIVRFYDRPSTEKAIVVEPPPDAAALIDEKNNDALIDVPFHQQKQRPHAGPKALITTFTAETTEQLQRFAARGSDKLRIQLSSLSTIDYYNPSLREQAALNAVDTINEELSEDGIETWAALIRRYSYDEQNIDNQIFAKNLQEQTERLNSAKSNLADAQAETETQRALWDAKITDLEVDGEAQVRVIRSEGNLYEAKKQAQGDLLIAQAIAEVDKAKANALSDIAGSEVYIAREMAPLLGTLSGGIVADLDPFNINDWVDRLVPKGG